jgi:ferrous iron transport protein B
VVPLISGTACAIPAIMATRNIENWKERLITILVTPFTTCSARLPVYLIIIALVIPEGRCFGLSYQALTLMLLYLLGFAAAILSAMILNRLLHIRSRSIVVVEMPNYKVPLLKNVGYTVIEKTKSFVYGAGKIILAISIILWFLGSNGISEKFHNAETLVEERIARDGLSPDSKAYIKSKLEEKEADRSEVQKGEIRVSLNPAAPGSIPSNRLDSLIAIAKKQEIASFKLEHSFMGYMGKAIEPVVKPLGYDWKIGIAVLTSFAAREVFVGTLATIYSVGSDEEETIKTRMATEVRAGTDQPLFNMASGISLMLFYAFAMQCMSTLAIVKKETNSWKWPVYQLIIMSLFAYIIALVAYQILK